MKIAICDDNHVFVDEVKRRIECRRVPIRNLKIDCYYSSQSLSEAYREGRRYDIVFLDIDMEERQAGIQAAYEIDALDKNVLLYYITSHDGDVTDALEGPHFQFISKNLFEVKFDRQLDRGLRKIWQTKELIAFPLDNDYVMLTPYELYAVGSEKRKAILYTKDSSVSLSLPLYRVERKLSLYPFHRCAKNCLLNISHAKLLRKKSVLMDNGQEFSISAKYLDGIKNVYYTQKTY